MMCFSRPALMTGLLMVAISELENYISVLVEPTLYIQAKLNF